MTNSKGRLIIITAPSGTGKGTIIDYIKKVKPDLYFSVSATTRSPREGEIDGLSYFFVTHEQFNKMIAQGDFLEYAEYIGEYYGTPKKPISERLSNGDDVVLEIEVQGAKQVMSIDPQAVTIFILPPDMSELERRLRGRGTDSEDKMNARLEQAKKELEEQHYYKHLVINDDVARAAEEIIAIIEAN